MEGEQIVMNGGGGSKTSRWGDYTSMSIDPVDDCTFWYTNEYLQSTGAAWSTRIANFSFTCCNPPSPLPAPVITSSTTAAGVVGTAFSYQITATNCPASFNATGLPVGLTVSASTGLISGTPAAAGTSSISFH